MQSCCIPGCNSYKQSAAKNIGYFKFPLHNVSLLDEWLEQIDSPDWIPSDTSQICSAHFKAKDVDWRANKKHSRLSPTAIPTIFPLRRNTARMRETRRQNRVAVEAETVALEISSVGINDREPRRHKVALLKRKHAIAISRDTIPGDINRDETIFGIKSKRRNILTKGDVDNSGDRLCSGAADGQKPLFKITVNEKYNNPLSSKPVPFETIYLPDYKDKEDVPEVVVVKVENKVSALQTSPKSLTKLNNVSTNDHSSYSRSSLPNVCNETLKPHIRQYSNDKLKRKDDVSIVPTSTQSNVRFVSQDHIYSNSSAVRVNPRDSNSKRESKQLRKRLEELKERRKREQLKIVRLQIHLTELEKQMKENNREEVVLPSLREGCESAGNRFSWLLREKEEYENLLKDVREIKLKVLRQRHAHELEKIRMLQTQMRNLGKKMKENDRKEIAALSNLRDTTSPAARRPDWMKREEEEYEKLLRDVRKIKQSYKLRQAERSCAKIDINKSMLQSEKVLNDEECVLIETMQKRNRLIKEIQDDDRLMHRIERGINLIDDDKAYSGVIGGMNNDCGEIIGVIDEDFIDIDMSKEVPILTLDEEMPVPGLLDT